MDPRRPREDRPDLFELVRPRRSVGPLILIPGYPQWSWRQKERALVLIGSYLVALLVGVLTWGTSVGLGVLAFAFVTHAFSAADAIRQYAFPGFGRMMPGITVSTGLGVVCYGPALLMASVFAWPITLDERPREGYFINRWAFSDASTAVT